MKRKLFLLLILSIVGLTQITFASDNRNVLGTWNVEVADAPAEFVKSSLTVTEEKGVLSAKVIFEDGQELKVSDIQFSKDIVNLVVTIDGSDIRISGKLENSKITGKVESPNGVLGLVAVKKV